MGYKVFNINMHRAWGGQPNRVLTESVELTRRGHEVWVAGPEGCELVRRARERGLPVFEQLALRRGFRPAPLWRDRQTLRRLFEREGFDLVHTHGSQDSWAVAAALLGMRPRPACVRTRHNTFPIAGHPLNRWLYRRMTDHVITISPQVNRYLTDAGLKDETDITPIYSAPDFERFDPDAVTPADRSEFGFGPEHTLVIMVGRLAPEKGHIHLVDAAARLRERHPEARYLFAGTGRSRPAIEARIAEQGLGDLIHLTGFRKDVPALLAASDIFVLSPVDGESLGTSILEGFLMGLPAVATDVGGVRESVRDGQTGFLVPPARPEPLAEAIARLLEDAALRRRLGRAGAELVRAEFTPTQIALQTEKVYEKALARRPH